MAPEIALAALALASAGGTPTTWTPVQRPLSSRASDGNPNTYELLRLGSNQDPVDFGWEWPLPRKLGSASFGFASLGGKVYGPEPTASRLEARVKGRWTAVPASCVVDGSRVGELAPLQERGTVTWTFRFGPVEADALRLSVGAPASLDPGYECIALASMTVGEADGRKVVPGFVFRSMPSEAPSWLAPGADLAVAGVVTTGAAAVIRWPKELLVNCVRTDRRSSSLRIDSLAGGAWRPLEVQATGEPGVFRFAPVATTGLRIHTSRPCTVHCDENAAHSYERVRVARTDLLGERFRAAPVRDLAEMDSLLLPLDFAKTAIGRPADLHETMAMWTGTFLMVETKPAVDPQTGQTMPPQAIDRWFAPVASKGRFGADWMQAHSQYVDCWMPGVVTTYVEGGLTYRQTLFVTSPDQPAYANVAIVDVMNTSGKPQTGKFAYAMGRRLFYGDDWTPFSQDPLPTGYRLDADRRTVRNAQGEVVLYASAAGKWAGTPRENHLAYAFRLAPGGKKRLAFLVPSVDTPTQRPPQLDPDRALAAFRNWWSKLFADTAQIDVPESRINHLVKNLLAQSLIITLDGDQVRYGAYQYEAYFGVEEGWPAVALAQYGLSDAAKKIAEIMLSPALMDKRNYHHQYRNGLDPWYAITIARLGQDLEWLRKIAPALRQAADWTIRVTEGNRDAKYGGILPRHVYGGDVGMPAYSFYSNATCWRGLFDTSVAMDLLGDPVASARYRDAADKYHQRVVALADQLVDSSGGLPFLSMAFDLDTPAGHREKEPAYPFLATHTGSADPRGDTWGYVGNYWNLFAPLLLEVKFFPEDDARAGWIPRYIEQRAGLLLGLARFDLGCDHIYGKGYIESLLEQGRREEFLTSLYSVLSNGMSRNLFSSPEVSGVFPLRVDNLAQYREHDRERWNWLYRPIGVWIGGWTNQEGEPESASSGMALQLLRMALVREDTSSDPPIRLKLLDGAPSHWFAKGKHVAVKGMRTFFGKVSFRVDSDGDVYRVHLSLPDVPCVLRLPHPRGLTLRSVRLNEQPWKRFKGNEVDLTGMHGNLRIEAKFR